MTEAFRSSIHVLAVQVVLSSSVTEWQQVNCLRIKQVHWKLLSGAWLTCLACTIRKEERLQKELKMVNCTWAAQSQSILWWRSIVFPTNWTISLLVLSISFDLFLTLKPVPKFSFFLRKYYCYCRMNRIPALLTHSSLCGNVDNKILQVSVVVISWNNFIAISEKICFFMSV